MIATGISAMYRPYINQVIDPDGRYEPNQRTIQTSTTSTETASMTGTASLKNCFTPGCRIARLGRYLNCTQRAVKSGRPKNPRIVPAVTPIAKLVMPYCL